MSNNKMIQIHTQYGHIRREVDTNRILLGLITLIGRGQIDHISLKRPYSLFFVVFTLFSPFLSIYLS